MTAEFGMHACCEERSSRPHLGAARMATDLICGHLACEWRAEQFQPLQPATSGPARILHLPTFPNSMVLMSL